MLPVIYLDMDGVVADFQRAAFRVARNQGLIQYRPETDEEDIVRALTQLLDGYDHATLWSEIEDAGVDFWRHMPALPWTGVLMNELQKIGEVIVLTHLTKRVNNRGDCASGKIIWLENQFGPNFQNFCLSRNKWLNAGPNSMLIDDSLKNCSQFKLRGGAAIHFNPESEYFTHNAEHWGDYVKNIISTVDQWAASVRNQREI